MSNTRTSEKAMEPYHSAVIERAHDVRHLRPCSFCEGLGDRRRLIAAHGQLWHGRCYIAFYGLGAFVKLPNEETDKVTLEDIGVEAMKYLLRWRK